MPVCRSSRKKSKAATEVQLENEEKKVETKPVAEVQSEVEQSEKPQATKKSQEEVRKGESKLKSAEKSAVEVEIGVKLIEFEDIKVNNMQSTSSVCSNSGNSVEFLEMLRILEASRSVTVEQFAKIIPDYDGITVPIRTWLENFNENASAYDLTEKQKYVNSRNKMKGTAKLFLETVSVSSYEALCKALIEEFDVILSSADVHQKLMQRKKRNEENFHEYVLQMRKLAALGTVEDEAVIRYIVDGVKVLDDLKYPLYSAKTFKELRDRFEIMQQMSGKQNNFVEQKQNYAKPVQKGRDGGSELRAATKQHCFNCGSTSHVRSQCEAETKCFRCNGSGHISKNCDKSNEKRAVSIITNDKRNKRMQINNKYFSCLIDTGADVSLMQQTVYEKHFSKFELSKSSAKLYGLGNIATTVKGALTAEVLVDKIKVDHTFLVIADSKISYEVIVGYDFIQRFQLEFNSDGYFFSEKTGEKHEEAFQCVYNVVESGYEIDVAPQYTEVVMKLINDYKPVANPAVHPIQIKIVPKGNLLNFNESPTRLSAAERAVVKNQIEEWLEQGIVRESIANIASKVVLTKKKDGSYRVCIDYKKRRKIKRIGQSYRGRIEENNNEEENAEKIDTEKVDEKIPDDESKKVTSLNSDDAKDQEETEDKEDSTVDEVNKEIESEEKEKPDDAQPETIDLDKVKDGPQPRALHRTSSIFLRNLAPSITKAEIEMLCQRFDGYLRVAIADPLVDRRWYRRGWVTFKRDVNIKEICWNLNNTRLRDCEMGAIVNRDLSRRVRPVNGMTAHKSIVRADIKLCAKIAMNLDEKFKLWVNIYKY